MGWNVILRKHCQFFSAGKSGQDYFCVTCSGWVDESDRNARSDIDDEAALTYEFVQINEGAKVSEIIHKSFGKKL